MNDKKSPTPFNLDMSFASALGRYIQTDPREALDVRRGELSDDTIDSLIEAFEEHSNTTEDGSEFWLARDLQGLFEYSKWENFESVMRKAMTACSNSQQETGQEVADHWVPEVRKSISGKGKEESVLDYRMSRYACYLTAQNADTRKRPVAFAQTYFAIQTRKQEIAERQSESVVPISEDGKRVLLRGQIAEHNKYLSSAAKGAGVITPAQFAAFHSKGYQGLYGGKTVPEIRRHKGLSKSAKILDRMGSTELAANFFRVTQTEEKLRKENIRGAANANTTHFEVGRQVRAAMLQISGIKPEDLPAVDSIARAKTRLKIIPHKGTIGTKTKPPLDTIPQEDFSSPTPAENQLASEPIEIALRSDLWKYALLVMVQRPNYEISTSELIAELPNYVALPEGTENNNTSRRDSKFSQIVRNLKSHKDSATNFIKLGYAEAIPRGFRATDKGHQFVLDFFKDRI